MPVELALNADKIYIEEKIPMSQSIILKPGLRSWLLLGLGLVCILVIESCVCCTGELNRRIGRDDLRTDAEKKTIAGTKGFSAHSQQESAAKSK
jgi:hypothetical protein